MTDTPSKSPACRKRGFLFLSPSGMLILTVLLAGAYAAAHAAGWRENVSLLAGTSFPGPTGRMGQAATAGGYIMLYFGAMVVAPILALASGIMWALQKILKRRKA